MSFTYTFKSWKIICFPLDVKRNKTSLNENFIFYIQESFNTTTN